MDMLEGEGGVRDYNLERLMMLSDGLFAIAMTLLALELRPPPGWDGQVGSLLDGLAGDFFAFFWSFASIAILWASHRQSFGRFRRSDFGLTFYNLLLLGFITLVPAMTRMLAQSHYNIGMVWLYIGLFQAIAVCNFLMWCHAAFVTDIVERTMPRRVRIVVALVLLILAPLMTALGVLSSQPNLRFASIFIPLVGFGSAYLRRWSERKPG